MCRRDNEHGPLIGQRHVLVIFANLGLAIVYCMRVNLSVAMVAMINNTEDIPIRNHSDVDNEDYCPLPKTIDVHPISASAEFNWSKELQGIVLSSFFWGYIVLQVPAGTLAQRYGGKWMYGIGVVWTAVLTLLTPIVARTNVYLLIALRVLEGLGESVTFPAVIAMLGRWSPPEESSWLLSLTLVGSSVGTIIGQLTAGPLCSSTFLGGWPSVFYIHGTMGILWLVPWLLLVSDSPQNHPRITPAEKRYIITAIGTDQEQANLGPLPWCRILTSIPVWVYYLLSIISAWINYTLLTCLPQFLSEVLYFDIKSNGIIASLPYFGYTVCSNTFGLLSEKMVVRGWMSKTKVRKLFTLISMWGCGVCLFAITFVSCQKPIVITLLVIGYSLYSASIAGFGSNALDLSPEYAGTVYGIGNMFSTAAGIVTPLVTDDITVNGTVTEWNLVLYIVSGVSVIGGLVYLFLGTAERQNWYVDSVPAERSGDLFATCEAEPIIINIEAEPSDIVLS